MKQIHFCLVSSYYESALFEKKFLERVSMQNAIQKFNRLLLEGLLSVDSVDVQCISALDANIEPERNPVFESIGGKSVEVRYAKNGHISKLRKLSVMLSTFFNVIKLPSKTVVLIDVLKVSGGVGAVLGAKLKRLHSVGIVTDLPEFQNVSSNRFMKSINDWLIRHTDSYVLLTEAMNDVVNPKGKPYCVMEGFADISMKEKEHAGWEQEKRIVVYAGSIHKKYGILKLVTAFSHIASDAEELWIFGDGDCADELKRVSAENNRIRFFGRKPNREVVDAETKATLLVNPRTAEGEYTKYSFPSKTLEYMVTGTPVLMYKLPGVPKEYDDYLCYIDDYTNFETAFRAMLDKPVSELQMIGERAKRFVIENKNNHSQAERMKSIEGLQFNEKN